jgi:prophage regulatory protein
MKIIDLNEVIKKTTLGKSTIYAYGKAGKMPAQIRLTDRSVGWIESEIDAWLKERAEVSRAAV